MADEDEVDVLGEFDLETLFTKEDERLICYDGMDIPSQWLLDTTAQPCWYADNKPLHTDDLVSMPSSWPVDADNWTSNEKDLLDRGLSLFGRSWTRLAQYVGTKTVHQVKTYVNSQSPSNFSEVGALGFAEIIDDFQIPASMEEVIAVVSTAQPTINHSDSSSSSSSRHKAKRGRPPSRLKPEHRVKGKRGPKPKLVGKNDAPRNPRGRPPKSVISLAPLKQSLLCAIDGEEVVRMTRDPDTDVEIDVDDVDSDGSQEMICEATEALVNGATGGEQDEEDVGFSMSEDNVVREEEVPMEETTAEAEDNHMEVKLSEQQLRMKTHQHVLDKISELPAPTTEARLNNHEISDLERQIHVEFFEGRAAKTPGRYLKIRNHITECWRVGRPTYVSKTSVRSGLKNCGDVNCIGRIHAYLERIGAINFGCEQTRYDRPLYTPSPYDHLPLGPAAAGKPRTARKPTQRSVQHSSALARDYVPQHGGYTITHQPDGTTETHVVVERRRQNSAVSQPIQLICCRRFDEENKKAAYSVDMYVSALIVMDVHAHASHCEVIGLLGGSVFNGRLAITRTVPCRAASSQVHCDMCPVSQTMASEQLRAEGCDVIGWYHSHPTFSPNPSLQDIVTQRSMQEHFRDRPFIGIILSPHTIASTYRCIVVLPDSKPANGEAKSVPYRHNVRLVAHNTDLALLRQQLEAVFARLAEQDTKDRFGETVNEQLPISYLDKCVESVTHHLGRCAGQMSQHDKTSVASLIRELATYYTKSA